MKEAAADVERKRQRELEKQRSNYKLHDIFVNPFHNIAVLKKQEQVEEEKRQAKVKKQRAEEKKRRKEEFEKLQALKKAQEEIEDEEETEGEQALQQ